MTKMFEESGYQPVSAMVSDDLVQIATQYALIDEMFSPQMDKDSQVPNSHSSYGDPLMESILLHLLPKMEYVTGLKLIPTYSYYRVYRPGMDLKPHKDRPACEISTTVAFGQNYMGSDTSWGMNVGEDPNNEIVMAPGDAVVYRGCDVNHWRRVFDAPEFSYHVQGFFHFIDANGPYAGEWDLDQRPMIGYRKPSEKPSASNNDLPSYITFTQ
jgi:hypothetical protein